MSYKENKLHPNYAPVYVAILTPDDSKDEAAFDHEGELIPAEDFSEEPPPDVAGEDKEEEPDGELGICVESLDTNMLPQRMFSILVLGLCQIGIDCNMTKDDLKKTLAAALDEAYDKAAPTLEKEELI